MSVSVDAAAAEARSAALRDSRNVTALLNVAHQYVMEGDKQAAREHAALAVEQDPSGHSTLRTASGIYDAAGDRDTAIRFAQKAAKTLPALAEYRLHLGALLLAEGRFREAVEHLAIHVSLPNAEVTGHRLLSSALFNCGQRDLAVKAIRRGLDNTPNDLQSILHYAWLLTAGGNYGDGYVQLKHAVEVAPESAEAWRALSGVQEMLGQLPEAMESAEKAVAYSPDIRDFREHRDHVAQMLGLLVKSTDTLPDTSEWMPPARRRTTRAVRRPSTFLDALQRRSGVIYAIMLRTVRTKYGHTQLGYFWAVLEPISHLVTLGSVFFLLNHSPPPVGDNLFLYYVTGLLPYLAFSHLCTELMTATHSNSALVQLPIINRFDVLIATSFLVMATELIVSMIIFSLSALLGEQGFPADPLTVFNAIIPLWLMSTGIGFLNAAIYEFMTSWESFFNSIVRLLYFASGIYYSPISMPDFVRNILEWNPILQCVEYFRSGFYEQYSPHWLKIEYIYTWASLALVLGLATERATRSRMRITV